MCSETSPYALRPFSLKVSLWNGSNVHLIDNGPHPSFQGRSSSTSSFNVSLLQAISGMMSLALCPQVVSQASQHQSFWEASHLWGLLCLPVYLHSSFPSLRHVQGSTPTGVSEGGCWPLTYSSLGFPFHFSLFVASSLNLWELWHVWADCHLCRQSSRGHGWLLPPPLLAGCLDCICCTVYIIWTVQWSPNLTRLWRLSYQCTLWSLAVCCFFEWEAWSLFCLLAILDSVFPSIQAGVFCRHTGIGLGTFPTPWFAWALSFLHTCYQ